MLKWKKKGNLCEIQVSHLATGSHKHLYGKGEFIIEKGCCCFAGLFV